MVARVHQLNIGDGGIPKRPVEQIRVTKEGVVGDSHNDMVVHGGAEKAVCIFSLESYKELEAKGFRVRRDTQNPDFRHRIGSPPVPGDLGENITSVGLSYEDVRPGNIFQIGEAQIQIVNPRTPCGTVSEVFGLYIGKEIFDVRVRHGDFTSPVWGKSGFYSRVVREGTINKIDEIVRL
jgi:MOSC domain-containing protein YiiM